MILLIFRLYFRPVNPRGGKQAEPVSATRLLDSKLSDSKLISLCSQINKLLNVTFFFNGSDRRSRKEFRNDIFKLKYSHSSILKQQYNWSVHFHTIKMHYDPIICVNAYGAAVY